MEVWELKLYFYPSAGGLNEKNKKKSTDDGGFFESFSGFLLELDCLAYLCFLLLGTGNKIDANKVNATARKLVGPISLS